MSSDSHPFRTLTPEFVMDAVESQGYLCDCRTLGLNSYENRVYQVGIEGEDPLVAKFYRPERWSEAQIREEHQFCFELVEHELPVVAPLVNDQGRACSPSVASGLRSIHAKGAMRRSWTISKTF